MANCEATIVISDIGITIVATLAETSLVTITLIDKDGLKVS